MGDYASCLTEIHNSLCCKGDKDQSQLQYVVDEFLVLFSQQAV